MALAKLSHVKEAVEKELRSSNADAWKLSFIATRVALRTGIDLAAIRPEQENDAAAIANVVEALQKMGYLSRS